MTLTEIMKTCEVENELHRDKDTWADPDFSSERLQVTNDLIKELALHVKQLRLDLNSREMCGGEK